jgi:hypothetical protein
MTIAEVFNLLSFIFGMATIVCLVLAYKISKMPARKQDVKIANLNGLGEFSFELRGLEKQKSVSVAVKAGALKNSIQGAAKARVKIQETTIAEAKNTLTYGVRRSKEVLIVSHQNSENIGLFSKKLPNSAHRKRVSNVRPTLH